jgi:hypothetical protein
VAAGIIRHGTSLSMAISVLNPKLDRRYAGRTASQARRATALTTRLRSEWAAAGRYFSKSAAARRRSSAGKPGLGGRDRPDGRVAATHSDTSLQSTLKNDSWLAGIIRISEVRQARRLARDRANRHAIWRHPW